MQPITPAQPVQLPAQTFPTTLEYTSHYGQNMFDINLNTYGNLDNYVKLLVDNNLNTPDPGNNNSFTFTVALVEDVNIYNTMTGKGYIYSTGWPDVLLSQTGQWLLSQSGKPLIAQ